MSLREAWLIATLTLIGRGRWIEAGEAARNVLRINPPATWHTGVTLVTIVRHER